MIFIQFPTKFTGLGVNPAMIMTYILLWLLYNMVTARQHANYHTKYNIIRICTFLFSFAAGFSTMSEIIKSATYHFNTKNDLIQVRDIIINTLRIKICRTTLNFTYNNIRLYNMNRDIYFSFGSFTKTNTIIWVRLEEAYYNRLKTPKQTWIGWKEILKRLAIGCKTPRLYTYPNSSTKWIRHIVMIWM